MSALTATQIPKPADEQAFERACVPLWCDLLGDPNVQRNGRRGQRQDGVDLFGIRNQDPDHLVGIQCKLKGDGKQLTEAEVRGEVDLALKFKPQLREYFIVTTAPDDRAMHELARVINGELRARKIQMLVYIWGWNTLEDKICSSSSAMRAFDPSFSPFSERILADTEALLLKQGEAAGLLAGQGLSLARIETLLIAQQAKVCDATVQVDALEAHLDAEIDSYRDLANEGQPKVALPRLEALRKRIQGSASGRILFRITANIGLCRLALGEDAEAAALLEAAYRHAPDEPKAIANQVLSLLLRGLWKEALDFGRKQLAIDPTNEGLASYVVQAAGHEPSIGEPLDIIPEDLRSAETVMVAHISVLSHRVPGPVWRQAARDALSVHPENDELQQLAAMADLDEVLSDERFQSTRRLTPEERKHLTWAAETFRGQWDKVRRSDAPPRPEHLALCANTAMSLFVLGRGQGALDVAREGLELAPGDADLLGRAAMIAIEGVDRAYARELLPKLLPGPETMALKFQDFMAREAWPELLELLREHGEFLPAPERAMASAAEKLAALAVAEKPVSEADLEAVARDAAADARAGVLVADFARERGFDDVADAAFEAALARIREDSHAADRLMVAHLAARRGAWRIAADLLIGHVDESQDNPHLRVLLRALVNDLPIRERALQVFERLPQALREAPTYLYGEGLVHLNRGALSAAEDCLRRAIAKSPELIDRRLALVTVLRRMGRDKEIKPVLDDLDLDRAEGTPGEKLHIAQLLRFVGEGPKALAYGYDALRSGRDDPDAALRYMGLVLLFPNDGTIKVPDSVAVDTWVKLSREDGTVYDFIIEAGDHHDGGALNPSHALAAATIGKRVGDQFSLPASFGNARTWSVVEIKDKYLHAAHEVMATFEHRFPGSSGFYSMTMPEGDIGPALEQVRRASEVRRRFADFYLVEHVPLNMVATQLGGNTIGFVEYIRWLGFDIEACIGIDSERVAADELIAQRRAGGAVLDTYTAWTAATLDALDVLQRVFGVITIPQSVLDELRILKDQQRLPSDDAPMMSLAWRDGRFYRQEHSSEDIRARRGLIEAQISKIETACEVGPSAAPNDLSELAVALLDAFDDTVLNAAYLARDGRLLVSEDMHYRNVVEEATGVQGVWLQAVFAYALQHELIDPLRYATLVAGLAARRHDHIALTPETLLTGFELDGDDEPWRYDAMADFIGTKTADLTSHLKVVQLFLQKIWMGEGLPSVRVMRATGMLLEKLLRYRTEDWALVLGFLRSQSRGRLRSYVETWLRGHFISPECLAVALQELQSRSFQTDQQESKKRLLPSDDRPKRQKSQRRRKSRR